MNSNKRTNKIKKVFLVAFLIITSVVILPFRDYALDYTQDETGEELKLYLGEIKVLSVNNPNRIVIGNPNIVDVTNVNKSEITLSPKAIGTTTLVIWDNFGEQPYQIRVLTEDMQEIKRRIDNMLAKLGLPGVYARAVEDEGKVILLGEVKTPAERERVSTALAALKDKTIDLILVREEEAVVDIDVEVLELDKDATRTIGFTWPSSQTITLAEAGFPQIASSRPIAKLFTIGNLYRSQFLWTIDALVQEGKARVLSRPRLACQSGKEAELLVGGEKPIFTTTVAATTGAQGTQVEYKEFGIKLKIKPTVTEQKQVKLALNVEISEVGTAEFIGQSTNRTAQAYPLSKRNASTELFLDNGQTLAIGGLTKQKLEEDVAKTAFLGDFPLIGALFRKKTTRIGDGINSRGNVELFIILTPTIVTERREALAKKNKETESSYALDTPFIEKVTPVSLQDYTRVVQKRILDNLNYPNAAKEAGFQGIVKLSLHVSYSGELLDVAVKSSSGYAILDENAMGVARQVTPYPPFPPSIEQKDLWIEIPIVYQLN